MQEIGKNIKIFKLSYQEIFENPNKITHNLLKFLNKKQTKKTNLFFNLNDQIKRKNNLNEENRKKRVKFLLSKIKNKKELELFNKIIKKN